jgi:CMP-N-acetylneuraminic acid synthetase
MRPKELAQDDTLMIDVVKHVLKDIGGNEKWVWILQPTSPFRTLEEIKKIKSIIDTGKYKSLYSVKPQVQPIDRTETWKNGTSWRINQNNFLYRFLY